MVRVSVDDMVEAVREAGKPVTAAEIGKRTGVTSQAIGQRRDELEADPRIEYAEVGSAIAYWYVGDEDHEPTFKRPPEGQPRDDDDVDDTDNTGAGREVSVDAAMGARGRWEKAEDVLFDMGVVLLTFSGVSVVVLASMLFGVLPLDLGTARAALIMFRASMAGFVISIGVLIVIMLRFSISYWSERTIGALRSPRQTYKSFKRDVLARRPRAPEASS